MSIEKIDTNFQIESSLGIDGIKWYPVNEEYFDIFGVNRTENGFVRMDEEAAKRVSEEVASLNYNTSGGRFVFETDANYIALKMKGKNSGMSHMTLVGSSGFDMYVDEGDGFFHFNIFPPKWKFNNEYECLVEFEKNRHYKHLYKYMKRKVMIYFPLYNNVSEVSIGIPETAILEKYNPYDKPPVVYYGSSITQGGCASRPGHNYPAIVSRKLNHDFLCLGFSGSAHGETAMAEYISKLDMSAFVYDYDSNDCDNPELLRERHFRFYDIIREKNKDIPIIFMSHHFSPRFEWLLEESRKVVMESFNKAKERGDNVYFIDGKKIFEGEFYDCCTVDGLHPNDYGFVKMADALIKTFKGEVK